MEKIIFKVKSLENGGDINFALKANVGLKITKPMANTTANNDAIKNQLKSLTVRNDRLAKILNSKTFQPLFIDSISSSANICDDENVQPQSNTAEGTTNRLLNGMENLTPPQIASHISAMNVNPRTPQNHMLARLHRDLDSPSAATRLRAMRALKSPANGPYNQFDVPHEEQDIITEEERQDVVPKTIQDVMKDVVVYVEARFGDDDRTASIKGAMAELGATVNDNFNKNTTHLIFSNGTQSTYNKAKQMNIPIVSILWIEACKKQLRLVDPAKYSIHNLEQYENPELYKKPKVKKFFQTESELKIKKRKHTPTIQKFKSIKIPKKAKDNITGMLNEFRERQANTSSGVDYFSANFKVVDLFNDTKITGGRRTASTSKRSLFPDPVASTSRKDEVSPALQSNKTDKTSHKSSASIALAKLPEASDVESPTIFKTPVNRKTILAPDVQHSANSLVRVTRRTSMLALSSPSVDNTPIQRHQQAMPAEINEITDNDDLTKNVSEPMEITPKVQTSPRVISNRRTNFISSEMDVTNPQPAISSTRKRNSMVPLRFKDFEVNTKKYFVKSPNNSQSEKTNRRRTLFAPNDATSSSTAVSASKKVDEARISHPNRRRTLFAINQTPSNGTDPSNQNYEEQVSTSNVNQSVFAPNQASSPLVAKTNVASLRRSLFKPPTATLSPLAITALTKADDTQKSNSKRRRTLLPPPSPKPLAASTSKKIGEVGDTTGNRRRTAAFTTSHTNPIATTISPLNNETAKNSSRRRTCFASSQASDHLNTSQDKPNHGVGSANVQTPPEGEAARNRNLSGQYLTPQSRTLFEEYSQRLTFSSTNKRQTVRDISLHIIEQRLKNINEIARMNRSVSESDVNIDVIDKSLSERVARSSPQLRSIEKATDNEVESLLPPPKKRRLLFNPTAYEEQVAMKSTESSDNNNTPTKVSADRAVQQKTKIRDTTHHSKQKQRRSTMDFKTEPPKPVKVYASIVKTNSTMNCLAYTNMNKDQISVINEAITTLGKFTVEANVTKKTTHLVTFESKRTQKFLRAIIRGLWILDYNWVTASLRAGIWLYEEPYENRSVSNAVSMCRAEAQAFGSKYKIEIFSHLDPIYISTKGKCPALKELYAMCGGRVTNSRLDAKFIVTDKFKKNLNQVCIHSDWILDSITAANCKNISTYKLMSV